MKDFDNPLGRMTDRIIGVAFEVHNYLGPGFVEAIYHNGMKKLLDDNEIPYESEKEIKIMLFDDIIGIHRLDLVAYGKVIVELKAVEDISKIHAAQLISYLKASNLPVGLILNFSKTKVQVRRYDLNDILKNSYYNKYNPYSNHPLIPAVLNTQENKDKSGN